MIAGKHSYRGWTNTIQCDLNIYNLTLNEAVDLAQNRPPWRLMSTYSLVVHARKKEVMTEHDETSHDIKL